MSRIMSLTFVLFAIAVVVSGCNSLESSSVSNIGNEDKTIAARVQQRLDADAVTQYSMVRVKVEYGFATVYGQEPTPDVEAHILSIIKNTPGVKGVETAY